MGLLRSVVAPSLVRGRAPALDAAHAAVLLALALRLVGLFHDFPYSYYGDELHLMKRAMALGAGDLDPRWYNKPAGLMYLLLLAYGLFYGAARLLGLVASAEVFGAWFLADWGPFLLIGRTLVLAFGVALVAGTVRLARAFGLGPLGVWLAGLAAALLPPLVQWSQVIKEDVPSAALAVWALALLLEAERRGDHRRACWAALLAGAASAFKYYGVLLLPVWPLLRLWPASAQPLGRRLAQLALELALFALAFVALTPYSFLRGAFLADLLGLWDSFWRALPAFDPDNGVLFTRGPGAMPGALALVVRQLVRPDILGLHILLLAALGALAALARPGRRRLVLALLLPMATYLLLATTLWAYHPSPRHASAVYPLVLVLAAGGIEVLVARAAPGVERRVGAAFLALLLLAPAATVSLRLQGERLKPDTRTLAAAWIARELPRDARILLDSYGPVLRPSPPAVDRRLARLATLPEDHPFLFRRREALELLRRHPPDPAFDVDELAHPWWSPRELSREEILKDRDNWRFGNPLVDRRPLPLGEYRRRGVRYVVTNSLAMERYDFPGASERYPAFVRFYRELRALTPLAVFDPTSLGAHGPVVYVYDLEAADQGWSRSRTQPAPSRR